MAIAASPPQFSVLVYSRTTGFRHASIPDGIAAIRALGEANGFSVDATEDPQAFTASNLGRYAAVVFLNTTGDVLDAAQQAAFEGYIRAGGGFVGIHSAADTEYDWPWYGALLGAYFASHPPIQTASIDVEDPNDASTVHLPSRWTRTDEWYNFRTNPRGAVHVLATVDESTYDPGPGAMGTDHPIAWCHAYDGGRAWYTAGGHTSESYTEPEFVAHLLGGIRSAAGLEPGACGGTLATTSTTTSTTSTTPPTSTTTTLPPRFSDQPLSGRLIRMAVRGVREPSLLVVSRDRNLSLGDADATAAGGLLLLSSTVPGGVQVSEQLPAERWRPLGAEASGYRWKAPPRSGGPIRSVTVRVGKGIRIAGNARTLRTQLAVDPSLLLVRLELGTRRYCMQFGGTISFAPGRRFRARDAPPPTRCQ